MKNIKNKKQPEIHRIPRVKISSWIEVCRKQVVCKLCAVGWAWMGLGMGEGGKRLSFLDQIIYVLIITNETTLYDRIKETTKQTNSTPPLTTSL